MSSQPNPAQLHAIAIAAKKAKDYRDKLVAKEYRPEFAAMFRGTFSVGPNQKKTQRVKADPAVLLAHLLARFGPRKQRQVVDEVIAALEVDAAIDEDDDKAAAATESAARLILETTREQRGTVRGPVSGKIICEIY